MRTDIIKVYKSLHTWTGLIAGMALFIAFYAGALTMFKQPLDRWASPPQPAANSHRVSVEQLPQLIQLTLQQHPKAALEFAVHLEPKESAPASLTWQEPLHENDDDHSRLSHDRHFWSGLDEQGRLVSGEYTPSPMAELIDILHQTAGIPGEGHHLWGVYVLGVIAVLYALALVSGVIILLPTLAQDLFAMRAGRNRKRFWLDAHNVIGFTSLPFHLIIAFTVVVFAFHDFLYDGLQVAVYGDRPLFERTPANALERDLTQLRSPQELLANLAAIDPRFQVEQLRFTDLAGPRAQVWANGTIDGEIMRAAHYGLAQLDPYSGAVTDATYMPGQNRGWAGIVISFFALHFGNFGGDFVRWLYFFMGLAGAFLFYSGNLLWIESRRRRQKRSTVVPEQRRSTRWMAAATVGVCWGSVAGVASAMVVGKWASAAFSDLTGVYMVTYYAVFLAAVTWVFLRGAGQGLVHLLWLCAITILAIPATGASALLLPAAPAWLHPQTAGVEGVALLAGLAFIYAARRAARRIAQSEADSVWYDAQPPASQAPLSPPESELERTGP